MIITKNAIPRRTVLRGIGATLGLPLLDSMVPALTALAATPAKAAMRFFSFSFPPFLFLPPFPPSLSFSFFPFPPPLPPFSPSLSPLFFLSFLPLTPPPLILFFPPSLSSPPFLPSWHPGAWNPHAISIDQVAAKELGRHTPLASLELGMEGANFAGSCDSGGFSCAFSYTIAWASGSTPLPMEHNPRAVFERLFGDSDSTDPVARQARMREQRSILDSVTDDVTRLRGSLGASDRRKVGAYLDAVRDVERRITIAERQDNSDVPLVERPMGVPATFRDHAELMYDLQLLAYQTDRTRVITFMCGHELSGRTYREIGVPDAHHPLSHHRNVPEALAKLTKINAYHTTLLASFLEKLRGTPDGDGSLLDHVMIMYGAGMSDSNAHSPYNLPILLLGGGAGQVKGGRHLVYPERTPLANLHVSLLDKLGVDVDRIGDSTGALPMLGAAERLSGV